MTLQQYDQILKNFNFYSRNSAVPFMGSAYFIILFPKTQTGTAASSWSETTLMIPLLIVFVTSVCFLALQAGI